MSGQDLWRHMPPAVFPSVLGLTGVAFGWSRLADVFGIAKVAAIFAQSAVFCLLCVFMLAYLAKALKRFGAVQEDLTKLPGRLGLCAGSLAWMLSASFVAAWSKLLGNIVLFSGICLHLAFLSAIITILSRSNSTERGATPAWHLTFVGFIAIPFGAVALGHFGLGSSVFFAILIIAFVVYFVALDRLTKFDVPKPQRPLQVIHLAPISLFASVAVLLNLPGLGLALLFLAGLVAVALVLHIGWLVEAGFSPLWGSFTFPSAAFALALINVGQEPGILTFSGVGVLICATLITLWVAARVLTMFVDGRLAKGTGASKS